MFLWKTKKRFYKHKITTKIDSNVILLEYNLLYSEANTFSKIDYQYIQSCESDYIINLWKLWKH